MWDKCKIWKKPNSREKFSWTSDCKSHKISVQVITSIRIDKSIQTIHLWQLPWHTSMYHSKVVYVFQNGISSWERLTMTAPGQLCYAHASVYPPIQFPYLRIHDPGLSYYTVILLTRHERISFNSYNEFYTRLLNYKGVLLISEMCAVIASNLFIWQGCSPKIKCQIPQKIELLKTQTPQIWNNRKFIAPKMVLKDSFPCYFKMLYSHFGWLLSSSYRFKYKNWMTLKIARTGSAAPPLPIP